MNNNNKLHLNVTSNNVLITEYSTTTQQDIVSYMDDNNIALNYVNYKCVLLDFIAENYLNDLSIDEYLDEALNMLEASI